MSRMTPAEAADHAEIAQLLQRYGQALDEKRYELLDTVFVPGAALRYEMEGGRPSTYPEMLKLFAEFNSAFWYTQHMFSNPVLELDGERARSVCRLFASHVQQPLAGGRNLWVVYGVYHDRLVRRPEGWRIEERVFRGLHTEGSLLPPDKVRRFDAAPG